MCLLYQLEALEFSFLSLSIAPSPPSIFPPALLSLSVPLWEKRQEHKFKMKLGGWEERMY